MVVRPGNLGVFAAIGATAIVGRLFFFGFAFGKETTVVFSQVSALDLSTAPFTKGEPRALPRFTPWCF